MDFPFLSDLCGNIDLLLGAHQNRRSAHFETGPTDRFRHLFSTDIAEEVFRTSLLDPNRLRVIRGGEVLSKDAYCSPLQLGVSENLTPAVDPVKARQAFDFGYTLVFQGIQTFWPAAKEFARNLEAEISFPIQMNVYISPPNGSALARHYDMHDVLVLQVQGTKLWELGPKDFDEPLEGKHPHKPGDSVRVEAEVLMQPGNVLFVPRGYLHRCVSGFQTSLHITIGMLGTSRYDVLKALVEQSAEDRRFREAMPMGYLRDGSGEASIEDAVKLFSDWAPELAAKVIERQQQVLDGVRRVPEATVFA